MSKRQQDEVAAERMDQLRTKALMEKEKKEEERMYTDLWYADMMAKAKREEDEAAQQLEANKKLLEVLSKQIASLAVKQKEEQQLKDEEATLLVWDYCAYKYGWPLTSDNCIVVHVSYYLIKANPRFQLTLKEQKTV